MTRLGYNMIPTARRALLSALLVLISPVPPDTAQEASPAASDPTRMSVDVNLVLLNAAVTDHKGRVVSDLSEQNFKVYEDSAPQRIKFFSREDRAVTAGLIVDHSGSMRRKLADVSAGARTFVQASHPDDQMFVVNFNEHVSSGLPPLTRFSNDPAQLEQAIANAPATGKTALYDAVVKALGMLKEGGPDKKVLLVISDGGDNASTHTRAETLMLAEQSSAIIYCVGIFDEDDPDRNPKLLKRLAEVTGGLAFFPTEPGEVSNICARIARDIRNQYIIGYSPSKPARPGEFRSIRVTASAPHHGKLVVRTRTGYRVGGEPKP